MRARSAERLCLIAGALAVPGAAIASQSARPRAVLAIPAPNESIAPWRVGDRLPAAMAIVPGEAPGRAYGIVIVDGRLVLVVDRETRRVVEILE